MNISLPTPSFSPGIFTKEYKEYLKKQRLLKKKKELAKKQKAKSKAKGKTSTYTCEWSFNSPKFHILPDSEFHPKIASLLHMLSCSLKQQFIFLNLHKKIPSFALTHLGFDCLISPDIVRSLRCAVAKTKEFRVIFRPLVLKFLEKRLRSMNTEDPITCDPPIHPIYIVDWKNRCKWVYESKSIMMDITSRLSNHDGLFEDPQVPRNMLTNLPLTQSQIISVWNQLYRSPSRPSMVFTGFRQVRYSLPRFYNYYMRPLKVHALKQTFKDVNHEDTKDRLLDFIDMIHAEANVPMYHASYSYVISNAIVCPLYTLWKMYCEAYYMIEILENSNGMIQMKQDLLIQKAIPLTKRQGEFVTLRNAHLRKLNVS